MNRYPRDMSGHGANPPAANWPNGAKIAVQIVLNYEEGGENCILHDDPASEAFLSEIVGAAAWPDQRHWNMESMYEYGARAGFWRLHRLFTELDIPATVYGVATALARNPEQVQAMQQAGWETVLNRRGTTWRKLDSATQENANAGNVAALLLEHPAMIKRPVLDVDGVITIGFKADQYQKIFN